MPNLKYRAITLAIITSFLLQGCATSTKRNLSDTFKDTFNNDDPCANSKRNIGIAIGALAGAVVGNKVSGDNKVAGTLIGALAGAGLGGFIGSEFDRRQCEIYKIQQKYNADIQITPIATDIKALGNKSQASTSGGTQNTEDNQSVGLSVNIIDKNEGQQFAIGSDELTESARAMFVEIANQYKAPKDMNKLSDEEKSKYKTRRVLLVGHTDDTGSSNFNAELSEKRAKKVATIFKEVGVEESQIFYQGAGETLPYADNADENGRALNRRVEIVDLSDEENFNLYLKNRHPKTEFYRPVTQDSNTALATADVEVKDDKLKSKDIKNSTKAQKNKASTVSESNVKNALEKKQSINWIDFGGNPINSSNAKLSIGESIKNDSKFTLISSAYADDLKTISTCNLDRPRESGQVKSLSNNKVYSTNEHFPGLTGRSWQDNVAGNLVILNRVAVLKDGSTLSSNPELKVYVNYNPEKNRNPKPDVFIQPKVNTYRGTNGLVYRVFAEGNKGLQCIDVLMPNKASGISSGGKIVYGRIDSPLVADFNPKIIK